MSRKRSAHRSKQSQSLQSAQSEPHRFGDIVIQPAVYDRRKRSKPPVPGQGSLWEQSQSGKGADRKGPAWAPGNAGDVPPAAEGEDGTLAGHAAEQSDPFLFQSSNHCCDGNETDGRLAAGSEAALTAADEVVRRGDWEGATLLGKELVIKPCWCRKWYCRECGPRMGAKLQAQTMHELTKWKAVYGIALTVDGLLFESQSAAWDYVRNKRLVPRLVRGLADRGRLLSRKYIWFLEWQKETEQPHWHLLVESDYVPFGDIVEIWSRFRPKAAPPLPFKVTCENYQDLERPAFGSVWFTQGSDVRRAAAYACKYLTKHPAQGFPQWVLDYVGRVPKYGHSRGFFPHVPNHGVCFCPVCRGEEREPRRQSKPKAEGTGLRRSPEPLTIGQRIERCQATTNVVEREILETPRGQIVQGRYLYVEKLSLPYSSCCTQLGCGDEIQPEMIVTAEELEWLRRAVPSAVGVAEDEEWNRGEKRAA